MNYVDLMRRHPHHLGFGMLHYFFSMPGQSILISLFIPHFNSELGIGNEQFGLLYSAATLLSAFTIPFFGNYIDRYKVRYVSTINGILLPQLLLELSYLVGY